MNETKSAHHFGDWFLKSSAVALWYFVVEVKRSHVDSANITPKHFCCDMHIVIDKALGGGERADCFQEMVDFLTEIFE